MPKGRLRYSLDWRTIDIYTETFGNHLFDVVVHHCVGFTGTRCSQYDGRAERIDHVDPAVVELAAILESGGQII